LRRHHAQASAAGALTSRLPSPPPPLIAGAEPITAAATRPAQLPDWPSPVDGLHYSTGSRPASSPPPPPLGTASGSSPTELSIAARYQGIDWNQKSAAEPVALPNSLQRERSRSPSPPGTSRPSHLGQAPLLAGTSFPRHTEKPASGATADALGGLHSLTLSVPSSPSATLSSPRLRTKALGHPANEQPQGYLDVPESLRAASARGTELATATSAPPGNHRVHDRRENQQLLGSGTIPSSDRVPERRTSRIRRKNESARVPERNIGSESEIRQDAVNTQIAAEMRAAAAPMLTPSPLQGYSSCLAPSLSAAEPAASQAALFPSGAAS